MFLRGSVGPRLVRGTISPVVARGRLWLSQQAHSLPSKPSTAVLEETHPEDETSARQLAELGRHILPVYARPPVLFVSGRGLDLTDSNGRTYLDFTGGIAVNALGHADPEFADVRHLGNS